jgi:XTP/dITP diphosphohydrolase
VLTLLLATRNRHKVRELRRLIGLPVRFLTMDQFEGLRSAREDGTTFRQNAKKKALAVSRRSPLLVLAEDSGIEVKALGGRPGVRSARFAGPAQSDEANNRKMLRSLKAVPASRRQARYVCCMALAAGGKLIRFFEGNCGGSIGFTPRGRGGFGYDPLFIPSGKSDTMAQLGARVKDKISHRAKAAAQLESYLKKGL